MYVSHNKGYLWQRPNIKKEPFFFLFKYQDIDTFRVRNWKAACYKYFVPVQLVGQNVEIILVEEGETQIVISCYSFLSFFLYNKGSWSNASTWRSLFDHFSNKSWHSLLPIIWRPRESTHGLSQSLFFPGTQKADTIPVVILVIRAALYMQ